MGPGRPPTIKVKDENHLWRITSMGGSWLLLILFQVLASYKCEGEGEGEGERERESGTSDCKAGCSAKSP